MTTIPEGWKCACVNVKMGSYDNQVELPYPFYPHKSSRPTVGIDRCVAEEIQRLWALGIQTSGHCCGHNVAPPYIGVEPEHISRMKALGYKVAPNPHRPGDEGEFYPKSVRRAASPAAPPCEKCGRTVPHTHHTITFTRDDAAPPAQTPAPPQKDEGESKNSQQNSGPDLGWLPIESAPKDATRVLLYWPHGLVSQGFRRMAGVFMPESGIALPWDSKPPTHWMPLPEPPREPR